MGTRLARLRIAFLVVLALVAAYGVVGAFVLPPIARHLVVARLEEALGRRVMLDGVAIAPYSLEAQAKGLRIFERDGRTVFASLDSLDIDASIASLRHLAPVLDQVRVGSPRVRLVREDAARFNFSDIVERLAAASRQAPREPPPQPQRFSASGIRVVKGVVDIEDRVVHATHRIAAIEIAVPFVSNLPTHGKDRVQPSFTAIVDDAPVRLAGETHPFEESLRTRFDIDLEDVDLARYVAYLPASVPLKVDAGKLDGHISLRFHQGGPAGEPAIDIAGALRLAGLALSSDAGALARIERIAADIASLDPLRGRAKIARVAVEGASTLQDAWKVRAIEARDIEADLAAHDVRVASLSTHGGNLALARQGDGAVSLPALPDLGPPSSKPWKVAVRDASISGYTLAVRDETVKPALDQRIVVSRLDAHDLSTAHGGSGRAEASLELDGGGAIHVASDFRLDPLQVEAKLDARSIDLKAARAYVATFPAVELRGGRASARGDLRLSADGAAMRVSYDGSAQVDGFSTWDSINGEDLLKWKRVKASGVKAGYGPDKALTLAVADIDVDGAYSRIFVSPDGKLNVQQLMDATAARPSATPPAGPPAAAKRDIRIDRIRFSASRLNFTDHYIRPNYTANVGEVHGSVKGLSSEPASRATVLLEGRWDRSSPVMIAGTVNPLRGDLFLDVGAKGEDIDLTKLSTYSQRYAGYRIDGGSLSLDVKYHVANGKLEGRNRILVDRLALGEKVESPDATSLPVAFLVNLLKDKDGRINLTLPISGSLDDPKFDFLAVVGQMFSGPLEKAQDSPFSLLAGTGGGGAEDAADLAFVEFAPAQDTLAPQARAKLDRLARLLQDHPAVKLSIAPGPVTAQDVKALRENAVRRALEAAPKDLPPEAREQIAQSVSVTPEDRRALAQARLERVRSYLSTSANLAGERVAVSTEAPPTTGAADASRVNFALR